MIEAVRCKICSTVCSNIFSAKVLLQYEASYFQCPSCLFLFPFPTPWLPDAYQNPINSSDTGYLDRNIRLKDFVSMLLFLFEHQNIQGLDYAGGYGAFTRLMRDAGFVFFWTDPFTPNIFAKGFEYSPQLSIDVITSFESIEHFENPIQELSKILHLSNSVILTTELLTNEKPSQDWWYYGFEHGQHIAFYTSKTLSEIARQFGFNVTTFKNIHWFAKHRRFMKLKLVTAYYLSRLKPPCVPLGRLKRKIESDSISVQNSALPQGQHETHIN